VEIRRYFWGVSNIAQSEPLGLRLIRIVTDWRWIRPKVRHSTGTEAVAAEARRVAAHAIDHNRIALKSGGTLDADLVIAGIGVRPRTELGEKAGLRLDRGVIVDVYLETSVPGLFAAGDIARWPDPHSGENIRVEHWVVAERQGQTAALNMLGRREKFVAVPFFWSQHYDIPINYVGHAEKWDELTIDGDVMAKDCLLRYKRNGRVLAVASIYRDVESLKAEVAMERDTA
jgi:NADPH-dependent 2,4-dienoyl-CoA reductase/sulfur reductase-like enzyme